MTSDGGRRSPKIRDAATLILHRQRGGHLEVLMGERAGTQAFMPNHYVFPGGRLDPNDYRIRPARPMNAASAARLGRAKRTGPLKAVALALAAIRETFEETGLRLAAPSEVPEPPKGWRGFCAEGVGPDPSALLYICRAVTPPKRPRRFDARFFAAPAEAAQGVLAPSPELGSLRWVTVEEALALPLPNITKLVIKNLPEWVAMADPAKPVPFFHAVRDSHVMDLE